MSGGEGRGQGRVSAGVLAASAICLGLVVWGGLAQRTYAVLPEDTVAADLLPTGLGSAVARTPEELDYLVRRQRPGESWVLGPRATSVVLVPETEGILLLVTLASALACWAVAVFALAPRVRSPGVPALLAGLLLASLLIAIGGVSPPRSAAGWVLPLVYVAATAFVPALFVSFALSFPRPRSAVRHPARLARGALALATVVAGWNVAAWAVCFRTTAPEGLAGTVLPSYVLRLMLVAGVATGCGLLWQGARRAPIAAERRQAWWILWGIALGATPYLLLRLVPRLLARAEPPVPEVFDRLVEMTIPAAFAIAVVKERFLDIEAVVRRSLIYAVLTLVAITAFFLVGVATARGLGVALGIPEAWGWALAGLGTGLLVLPLHRTVGRLVDRSVFGIRTRHERALADLDRDLADAVGQAEVAERLVAFLDATLAPRTSAVAVASGEDVEVRGSLPAAPAREAFLTLEGAGGGDVLAARVRSTTTPEAEAAWTATLEASGAVVTRSAARGGRLRVLLLVGERTTGHAWVKEDLRILEVAARAAGRALERVALVQEAAAEVLARRALADLDRRKADFFARVAHDLRTPVAGVRWSVRNLLDGIPGPLTPRQQEYLRGVDAAAIHLGRLVENVADVGRLELGQPAEPAEPVDWSSVVHEATLVLSGLAAQGSVRVVVEAPADLPRVRARRQAASQIAVNLLDNAIKHAPGGTTVELALARETDGSVSLRVRDHGPGIPERDRERLFDLFARGAEASGTPWSGLGIGLYVVRRWVEALGGSVEAADHPGGGALFTCRLPVWTQETRA